MRAIAPKQELVASLAADPLLRGIDWEQLGNRYEEISERFHSHFVHGSEHHHQNALFHRIRYLELLKHRWTGRVLDVGNDKPFLSHFLRAFNPGATFDVISNEIPETPYLLHEVDIERERFPFADSAFDQVIFTEVIEHLWRDPSHCVCEINRVLKTGGNVFVTTPNPCDRHSLVCVLWQANPNQRSGYYATLESGHLHLWTVGQLKLLFERHGFRPEVATTQDLYGHTKKDENVERFIAQVSPYRELMNEAVVLEARKETPVSSPVYPSEIFPDGTPVQVQGAIVGWFADHIATTMDKK